MVKDSHGGHYADVQAPLRKLQDDNRALRRQRGPNIVARRLRTIRSSQIVLSQAYPRNAEGREACQASEQIRITGICQPPLGTAKEPRKRRE